MAYRGGLEMKIEMSRGKDRHIVRDDDGTFYLVDLMYNEATRATPPDSPDIFLKAGMWYDAGKVDSKTLDEVKEAMKHKKNQPK